MVARCRAAIAGVGAYVPERVLSNADLEKMVETSDDWIVKRTGIRERRVLDAETPTSYLGVRAVRDLLDKTGVDPLSVDALFCGTNTADMKFPATSNLVAKETGLDRAYCFDIQAGCSGFLYGLSTGTSLIEAGRHTRVIVLGAEKMSSIVDYRDRSNCILFGDGGGGVLLERSENAYGIERFFNRSDGKGSHLLYQKAGGSLHPASSATVDAREHYLHQEGAAIFKLAGKSMAEACKEVLRTSNLSVEDIDWVVPHQANLRIIRTVQSELNVPEEKVLVNIQKYGNTSVATLPLCLWDFEKNFKKGDKMLLVTFGAGLSWGCVYLTWSYDANDRA